MKRITVASELHLYPVYKWIKDNLGINDYKFYYDKRYVHQYYHSILIEFRNDEDYNLFRLTMKTETLYGKFHITEA